MLSLLTQPVWLWLAVAAALLAVEVMTGSGYLLWASASAGVVAVLAAAGVRIGLAGEVVVFAALSIASALLTRRFWPRHTEPESDLNANNDRLIGKSGYTVATFGKGGGRVFVDGKEWSADADADLALGARIEVLAVIGGSRLRVRGV